MTLIELPIQPIATIHQSSIPKNFTFVGRTGPLYHCNIVLAQLLAPSLAKLVASDPTIDSFYVEIENSDDFALFCSLIETGVTIVSPDRHRVYLSIARQLGNDELIKKLWPFHPSPDELNATNIMAELQFCEEFDQFGDGVLDYAAQHFNEISPLLECQFTARTLDRILSRRLVLDSEDSLFDFIKNENEKRGGAFFELLSRIDLRYLSMDKIAEFCNLIELRGISAGIWDRIRERLLWRECHTVIQPGIDYFDGVFANLKRKTGGNCAVNETITTSASNTHCGTLTILFDKSDWGQSSYWHHDNVKDGWFQVDLRRRRLMMTHYAIHNSVYWVREYDFLKTWTVEGSNDKKAWFVIDSRRNDETLHGASKVQALFPCNGGERQAFRFIRLYQRGASHHPSCFHFLISQFEVFGLLYE
jgi:hypothetical protein